MPPTPPPILAHEFRRSKRLLKYYESLADSTLDWISRRLERARTEKTRKKVAREIAEWLMETMEAERDLPPLISTALARNPHAREGWEKMPRARRRLYLLSILESRYPETRARSVQYALKEWSRSAGYFDDDPSSLEWP